MHGRSGSLRRKEYHQEHQDLNVPADYITKGGCRLGFWIKEQRKSIRHVN